MIGTALGHFTITNHLGSGGMGEVYQATDAKLGRDVAVKFLSEAFVHDTSHLARLQREARALAALNHPHVAADHEVPEGQTHDASAHMMARLGVASFEWFAALDKRTMMLCALEYSRLSFA